MTRAALPVGFDAALASRLCFLSVLAYDCFEADKRNPDGAFCLDNFAFILRVEEGRQLVAFQGSNDPTDFLLDALAVIKEPEDAPGFPPVHLGFWKAANALLGHLMGVLDKSKPVVLGGHSLGGGMALLLAKLLSDAGYTVEAVYGLGTPRVGAVKWFNRYRDLNIPTYLTVLGRDVVPMLPRWGVQVMPEIWLDLRAYPLKERLGFSWLNPFRWGAAAKDHEADGYLAALAKIQDRQRQNGPA